ncbi:MAG: dienelactone hydrolase family protein [Candidatus Limnocylindria bacterium]
MRRRTVVLLVVAAVLAALWPSVLYPGGKAALLIADVYSTALTGTNVTEVFTPDPRQRETEEVFAGERMRVSWWRPGWGDRHPGVMLVNGATPAGNDDFETRRISAALARAGYLVMLPEFAFLREARLELAATRQVAAAFGHLRGREETGGKPAGAFGFSVGGGILLAAAGHEDELREADYLAVLGAYFDWDTYLASVVTRAQLREGTVVSWMPHPEVRARLPLAVLSVLPDDADREVLERALAAGEGRVTGPEPAALSEEGRALWRVFAATDFAECLRLIRELSPGAREVFDLLSPETSWARVAQPVYWIHDANDTFEPLAEAEAARAAPRDGRLEIVTPRLISHAVPLGEEARSRGLDFWVSELWALLRFAIGVFRVAG